jgi:survival-of-motor-neuron-related-splicing factor 30
LFQVEVALTAEPGNAELLKLKEDLEQVIQLTKDLISAQLDQGSSKGPDSDPTDSKKSESSSSKRKLDNLVPVKHWQVGEQCQALYDKDGL